LPIPINFLDYPTSLNAESNQMVKPNGKWRLTIILMLLFIVNTGFILLQASSVSLALPYSKPGSEGEVRRAAAIAALLASAKQQLATTRSYDPAYVKLDYPGGDVPGHTGVCADVIVRALRQAGVDLQQQVHEDMRRHFRAYPQRWGLKRPDPNIDHRRVANLMRYFQRQGKALAINQQFSQQPTNYQPGDIVAWRLDNGLLHIGLVVAAQSAGTPLIVHNIGAGAQQEDVLFRWSIIGHYRYFD
jgi:uncharacterized protein